MKSGASRKKEKEGLGMDSSQILTGIEEKLVTFIQGFKTYPKNSSRTEFKSSKS